MRIIYIGRHGNTRKSNDDEGAIAHALEELGHDVTCLAENETLPRRAGHRNLILFHHWQDPAPVEALAGVRAFWCFDRIDQPDDPTLAARNARRKEWARRVTQLADVGFMTDGDWVARDRSGRLVHLPQGCDGTAWPCPQRAEFLYPLLFTGIAAGGGVARESFVRELAERYGGQFTHIQRGTHGRGLAQALASARVVVAPDFPVSDRYWSNRVYLTLGLGGFLLHPYCAGLAEQYGPGELVTYRDRVELVRLIDRYLDPAHAAEREAIRRAGAERTHAAHTYKHRCERLLAVVAERFDLR